MGRSGYRFVAGGACLLAFACGDSSDDTTSRTAPVDGGIDVNKIAVGFDAAPEARHDSVPDAAVDTAAPAVSALGKVCKSDGECGGTAGLKCLASTDKSLFGGGPSNGYCTLDCLSSGNGGTDPCLAVGGECLHFGDTGQPGESAWCALSCSTGSSVDPSDKCQGRRDLACVEMKANSGKGLCQPVCGSDDDCGSRHCDPRVGVCVDAKPQGDPIGMHCSGDPDAAPTCAGTCVSVGTIAKVCSSPCVQGDPYACLHGDGTDGGGAARATICGLSQTADPGVGDLGFCSQLCDTDSDCFDQDDPGIYCDKRQVKQLGRGMCFWGTPDGGTSHADAAADAKTDSEAAAPHDAGSVDGG